MKDKEVLIVENYFPCLECKRLPVSLRVLQTLIGLGILVPCIPIFSQAVASAERKLELQTYAMGSGVWSDYHRGRNLSFTAGGSLAFLGTAVRGVYPALTVRFTAPVFDGQVGAWRTVLVGPEFGRWFRWGRPYGQVLVGTGHVTFVHPKGKYKSDDSIVTAFGGGADVAVTPRIWIRGEIQSQRWDFDVKNRFTPFQANLGIVYVIR